jgi:uncharacterized protein (DUF1330 family)
VAYEVTFGIQVMDEVMYADYRKGISALLRDHGGRFRYDFKVSDVLISESDSPINRVFIIEFETKAQKEALFANPEYLAIKAKFFHPSVGSTVLLSEKG